jgi:hypothetical protein
MHVKLAGVTGLRHDDFEELGEVELIWVVEFACVFGMARSARRS